LFTQRKGIFTIHSPSVMKKLLIIGFLMLIVANAWARKVKGYIVKDGKSREVTFNVRVNFLADEPNLEKLQFRVKYYDENGKKHILLPTDASEISFDLGGTPVRMVSVTNTLNLGSIFSSNPRVFLKIEIDGPLKMYRYYYTQHNPSMYTGAGVGFSTGYSYTLDNVVFQKGNGILKNIKGLGWKKDMMEYFEDCPALAGLIENKDLKRRDVEAIVTFYNQNCGRR
jgi:hypothetical protein